MFIRFMCPACGRRSKAPAEKAGTVGKCVACGALVRVPQLPTVPASPSTAGGAYVGASSSSSGGMVFEQSSSRDMTGPPDVAAPVTPGLPLRGMRIDGRLTIELYARLVQQSGLVDPAALQQRITLVETATSARPIEPALLGKALCDAGLLTPWQDEMLRKGLDQGYFLGRYKLLKELGSGGMGSVYLAEHSMLRRLVAVKVLHGNKASFANSLARFYRESQTTAQLDHPNVVRVHDFDTNGELYYLVLEYVDGPNLQDYVAGRGPLPYGQAANFISQASAGLNYAHEMGLVHRDVKPPNLLLNPKGVVKISDLGLARIMDHDGPSVTVDEGGVLGTTDFLAPEQALDSSKVEPRADIYALGCTLFFLVTGRPPFPTGTMAQRLLMHQLQKPPRLKQFRPDCPQELQDICDQMMAKNVEERPTAAQVRQRLAMYVAMHPDPPMPTSRPPSPIVGSAETRTPGDTNG